jgi:hypothetical protein
MSSSSSSSLYRGRRAATLGNDTVRVTALVEGGHIAQILDTRTGVNPLWTPVWPSVEPSQFGAEHQAVYGSGPDGKLLAGIMGHNLCLDIFGGPSDAEAAAGLTAHGEASIAPYDTVITDGRMSMRAQLPMAALTVERELTLFYRSVHIRETVRNVSACDRPVGWTQHVTLGPPFLENGLTEFRASATRSKVFEAGFGAGDYLAPGAEFDWPMAPRHDGGTADLRRLTDAPVSSAYTAHLMDPRREHAFFVAFSPRARLAFGYVWRRADFPWMGIWEENRSRVASPWCGESIARGMEFGASPMPETRRQMIDRGHLFDVPTYRWLPAGSATTVEYWAVLRASDEVPDVLEWPA